MLHRVLEKPCDNLSPNGGLTVSSIKLKNFILKAKKSGWQFISMDDLKNEKKIKNKNSFIFTFDDGYLDNFKTALPILENFEIPFTVYITTNFISKQITPWWYLLEKYILSDHSISELIGYNISNDDLKNPNLERLFLLIRELILNDSPRSEFIKSSLQNFFNENKNEFIRYFMDWEDVIKMSKSPFATIGSHCINHECLANLNNEECFKEIKKSREIIFEKVGYFPKHIAYRIY